MKTAPIKTALAFILGAVFSVALLVKCSSSSKSGGPLADANAAGGNWEYAAIDAYNGNSVDMPPGQTAPSTSQCIAEASPAMTTTCILNVLGANGWQLIAIYSDTNGYDAFLAKPSP